MARAKESPTMDLAAGRRSLKEDLPKVLAHLEADSVTTLGWRKPNNQTLLVPMKGTFQDKTEEYCLKLFFCSSREWPPSAQFVNPQTLDYCFPDDKIHLPDLRGAEVKVHPTYGTQKIQLICCSATFEFYEVLHNVETKHLWRSSDNFYQIISAIERALNSPEYFGRHAAGV